MFSPLLVLALAASQRGPATPSIPARLNAYEAHVAQTGHPDAEALASIARAVIEQGRRSRTFDTWSTACASTLVPDNEACGSRLHAVLDAADQTLTARAAAAAVLLERGDASGGVDLARILEKTATPKLTSLAPVIAKLPAGAAVPLLVRLARSGSEAAEEAACRALGGFDDPRSRAALRDIVSARPPGTRTWLVCMIARARLREPDTAGALWGYGHDLPVDDQTYVAQAMVEVGHDSAGTLLTDLTHRGSPLTKVEAALLLAPADPAAAGAVAGDAETDPDPKVRAAALDVERQLHRAPSATVRRLLVDPAAAVRLKAADVCLKWAVTERNR